MIEFDCDVHQEDKDEIWACLSCYDAGVARKERERIIKLLEEHNAAYWESECICGADIDKGIEAHRIALIKGEQ